MLPSKPMTRRLFSIAALSSLSLTIGCAAKPMQATCTNPVTDQNVPATSSLIGWDFDESVVIHLMENMSASPEDSKSIRKIIQSSDDTEISQQMTAAAISPKTIAALQRLLKEYPESVGGPHDLSVKPDVKDGTIVTGFFAVKRDNKIYVAYSLRSGNLELPFTGGVLMKIRTGSQNENFIPLGNGTKWILIVPK